MKKKKFYPLLFGWPLLVLLAYEYLYDGPKAQKQFLSDKAVLDTSEINGRIKYINEETFNGEAFIMQNEPEKLYVANIIFLGPGNRGKEFRWIAEIGDSISKHPHSDTLILIKKDITYYCLATL